MNNNQLPQFDYTVLDQETQIVVQQRTEEIRNWFNSSHPASRDMIDLGTKLIEIKGRLGDHHFSEWLGIEFTWGDEEIALNFIQVAENAQRGAIYVTAAELNLIQVSALYKLCAPKSPHSALVAAVNLAKQGIEVTSQMASGLIAGQDYRTLLIRTEKQLQTAFVEYLEAQGEACQIEVNCSVGRADIVTADAIYEIKHPIDREGLFKAVGQVLLYRAAINPSLRAVIVFLEPQTDDFQPYIDAVLATGIEVILWRI